MTLYERTYESYEFQVSMGRTKHLPALIAYEYGMHIKVIHLKLDKLY